LGGVFVKRGDYLGEKEVNRLLKKKKKERRTKINATPAQIMKKQKT